MSPVKLPDLAVVVPVYNSGSYLASFLERVMHALDVQSIAYEIIFADDCSSDNSWNAISLLAQQYPCVAGVRLPVNMGQHAATIAGLQVARAPLCITMDDDFEHLPEQIPVLYAALSPSEDVVYAAAQVSRNPHYYVLVANLARCFIALCCRAPYLCRMRTFRVMRSNAYPWHALEIHPHLVIDGLLSTQKLRVASIQVPYGKSARGASTYNLRRLGAMIFMTCLTGILRRPLAPPQGYKKLEIMKTGWAQ